MRKTFVPVLVALFSVVLVAGEGDPAPKPILKKGARVAIIGDSITEQKLYSRYMELYLLACMSHLDLNTIQFGWSGERAGGFANRMNNDLIPFKPDIATTCYGMNDGSYQKYNPGIGAAFSPFDATSSTAGYGLHAGVEFKPTSNLSLSLGVGYTQPSGRLDTDTPSPSLSNASQFDLVRGQR